MAAASCILREILVAYQHPTLIPQFRKEYISELRSKFSATAAEDISVYACSNKMQRYTIPLT